MQTPLPPHTSTHPLDRIDRIEAARRQVLLEGSLNPSQWVPPWIDRSWRRCLALGQTHDRPLVFNAVSARDVAAALETSQPLLRAAAPVIRSLARVMADTRYFAILTNAQGVVIDVNGPIDRHDPHADLIARVGVDLSEHAVGTTAIGTTLTELQPVWLHRGEHFFNDAAVYSCAGAPLFGPDGRCVGMLDLTGIQVPERPALKHLVTQSARSIENALTLAQPHELLLRINWLDRPLGQDGDGLVCLDGDGWLTGTNRAAAEILALVPGQRLPHADDVFAVASDQLFEQGRHHRAALEVPLWSGLRLQLQAQLSHDGAQLVSPPSASLKDVEAALIRKAVQDARGNVKEAASKLGISRATVYRKLPRQRRDG